MFDGNDPAVRAIEARYLEHLGDFVRKANDTTAEMDERAAALDEQRKQQDAQLARLQDELEKAKQAAADEQVKTGRDDGWARREQSTVLAIGSDEEGQDSGGMATPATDVRTPASSPIPQTGGPAVSTPAPADEEDDYSNQSWLR